MAAPGRNGDVRVEGVDRFLNLARSLNAAGRGDLVKDLRKGLQNAAKNTVTPATRAAARQQLPRRGGLADRVARTPQPVTARVGGTSASVTMRVGRKGSGARGADEGLVRHPVFGNRGAFVSQRVPGGWFTRTAVGKKEQVRSDVRSVLDDFTDRIVRGL